MEVVAVEKEVRKYLQDVLESSKRLNDHWKWVESGNGVDRGYD